MHVYMCTRAPMNLCTYKQDHPFTADHFSEGSRSRSGKLMHPKGGLLSVLVDSVSDGVCPLCSTSCLS